jgi:hypothetical protein
MISNPWNLFACQAVAFGEGWCSFVFFAASLPSLSAPASFAVGSGVANLFPTFGIFCVVLRVLRAIFQPLDSFYAFWCFLPLRCWHSPASLRVAKAGWLKFPVLPLVCNRPGSRMVRSLLYPVGGWTIIKINLSKFLIELRLQP